MYQVPLTFIHRNLVPTPPVIHPNLNVLPEL